MDTNLPSTKVNSQVILFSSVNVATHLPLEWTSTSCAKLYVLPLYVKELISLPLYKKSNESSILANALSTLARPSPPKLLFIPSSDMNTYASPSAYTVTGSYIV